MKIAFIIDDRRYIRGGTYSLYKYIEYLNSFNHKILIISNFNSTYIKKYKAKNNIKHYIIPHINKNIKGISVVDKIIELSFYFLICKSLLKMFNPDLIVGHQLMSGIRSHKLAKQLNIPYIIFVFESPTWLASTYWTQFKPDKNRLHYLGQWKNFMKALQHSNAIITYSKHTAQYIKKDIKYKDIYVIPPGVEINNVKILHKDNKILYLGALYRNKNVDEIIKALQLIDNPPTLLICGDGYEKKKLINLANKLNVKIEVKESIHDNDKWILLSKSKFMIFPSSFEGFGMPPMEALASGIPCICSDLPIFKEIYGDKLEYFNEHNIPHLADKIRLLLKNSNYCKIRGKEGQLYIKSNFNWEKSVKKIENVFKNVVK